MYFKKHLIFPCLKAGTLRRYLVKNKAWCRNRTDITALFADHALSMDSALALRLNSRTSYGSSTYPSGTTGTNISEDIAT